MVFGDFNLEPTNPVMINFMDSQNFTNLIKNNTCFKGVGSCIDLILTNRKYCFKNTSSYESGISDHHHLIFSIMKTTFASEEPKKFVYREYFDKLNVKTTIKPFWKTCNPYFSNKHSHGGSKVTLTENDRIVSESNKIAKTFNMYFESVTDLLNLFEWIGESVNSKDKIEQIIVKFSKHPSILKAKSQNKQKILSFQSVSEDTVKNVVKNFLSDKATASEIPVDILKNLSFALVR